MERINRDTDVQDVSITKDSTKIFRLVLVLVFITLLCNLILNFNIVEGTLVWFFSESFSFGLLILSAVLLIPTFLLLLVITNSLINSSLIMIFISAFVSFSNSNKLLLRNEPMYPLDVTFITSIDDLLLMISAEQTNVIYFLSALLILSTLIIIMIHRRYDLTFFKNSRKSWLTRFALFFVLVGFNLYIFNFNNGTNLIAHSSNVLGFKNSRHHQKIVYQNNGFILGFANNFPGQAMEKPVNYSEELVKNVMAEYSLIADNINSSREFEMFSDVSVVYILSESFSDPNMINGIELNDSPVNYVSSPHDKAYVGNLIVPSYGGGTSNAEFELLTGLSIQHLLPNMALPYQDFLSSYKSFPSFVSDFKKNDNNLAISLHSFTSEMYKRPAVYSTLGFDVQMYRDNMTEPQGIENSIYVSDSSTYSNIIELLEYYQEDLFIHTVTMQNHSPYYKQFDNNDFEVMSGKGNSDEEIANFAQGVAITDRETEVLIDTISKMERDVIVVFYGDHIPGLYEDYSDFNDAIDFARTPYFVYSNFSSPSYSLNGDQSLTSMNNLVKDLAGVRVTPYDALVHELRSNLPAGRYDYYINSVEEMHEYDSLDIHQKKLISDFKLIQYDIISGKKYSLN